LYLVGVKLFCLTILILISPVSGFGQLIHTLSGHQGPVNAVAFSPDGKIIASGSDDKSIIIWNLKTGEKISTIQGFKDGVKQLVFSPEGDKILAADRSGNLQLFEINSGNEIADFKTRSFFITKIGFSQDGERVISCQLNTFSVTRIWDANTQQQISKRPLNPGFTAIAMDFTKDLNYAFIGGSGQKTNNILWDFNNNKILREFPGHTYGVNCVSLSKDDKFAISGSMDKTIRLWDLSNEQSIKTFSGHKKAVSSIAFFSNGLNFLSGSHDGLIKQWDISDGSEIHTYSGHKGMIESIAISPSGKFAVSGGRDNKVMVWFITNRNHSITEIISKGVERWEKKGKFETTTAFKARVNEESRKAFTKSYSSIVIDSVGRAQFDTRILSSDYDADNETFEIDFVNQTRIYVQVPLTEARSFDANLSKLEFIKMDFDLDQKGGFFLRKASLRNPANGKTYFFDSGMELTYNTDQLNLKFDPIELELQQKTSAQKINKGVNKVTVGKSDVDTNIRTTQSLNLDAIAVVIGNSNYLGETPNVNFAINDAKTVRSYLEKTFGYKPGNIIAQNDATLSDMRVLFGDEKHQGKLANYIKPGKSDVFVFYSGHGAPDVNSNKGFMLPVNADPGAISITGYPLETLYNNLSTMNARSVQVVIDACFSGSTGSGEMLIKNASPVGIRVINPVVKIPNSFIITASQGNQIASWYPEKNHGLLTYFYLKGLQGAADLNLDKKISSAELKSYLQDKTNGVPYWARRLYGRDQVPDIISSEDRVLLDLSE
jgi:WD40 repeat protein